MNTGAYSDACTSLTKREQSDIFAVNNMGVGEMSRIVYAIIVLEICVAYRIQRD